MRKSMSIVMLICVLGLIACGGGTSNTASTSSSKKSITAHPAVGHKSGVVHQGVSLEKDPLGNGVNYDCKSNMDSIGVQFLKTVDYNGTNIEFKSEPSSYDSDEPGIQQDSASLHFSGNLTSLRGKAVSLIVDTIAVYYDEDEKPNFSPTDMYVVNLKPDMITNGVTLETSDFVSGGYIDEITICAKR